MGVKSDIVCASRLPIAGFFQVVLSPWTLSLRMGSEKCGHDPHASLTRQETRNSCHRSRPR